MTLTVVKVGGSLARGGRLPALCEGLSRTAARHELLVVPGGGAFADAVRELDARANLSPAAAHWMAVLAMDQYGMALADLISGAGCVRTASEARPLTAGGRAAVLLPFDWLRRADPLPHDWSVTSDSIAAWVAAEAGAALLALLKDRPALALPLRGAAAPRGAVDAADLGAWEALDGFFGELLQGIGADVWVLDGGRPELLDELLDRGATEGVSLRRPPP